MGLGPRRPLTNTCTVGAGGLEPPTPCLQGVPKTHHTSPGLLIFVTVTNVNTPERERFLDGFLDASQRASTRNRIRRKRPTPFRNPMPSGATPPCTRGSRHRSANQPTTSAAFERSATSSGRSASQSAAAKSEHVNLGVKYPIVRFPECPCPVPLRRPSGS
jgi:hypothetical protein